MATPPLVSHPSPSSSSDVEEEEAEPEAKVARLCSGKQPNFDIPVRKF